MRSDLLTCAATAALLSFAGLASPALAQQATGTFQTSCRNIQTSGATLTAECADRAGAYHTSSIAFGQCHGDIGNNNGLLNCNGATATEAAQNVNNGRGNGNGNANPGQPVVAGNPSSGSFQRNCRNFQTSGSTLSADCADSSGRYHSSRIAFGQCRGDIGNSNGMLSCNGATAIATNGSNSGANNGFNNDNGNGRNNGFGTNGNNGNFGNNGNNGSNGQRGDNLSNGPRFDNQSQGDRRYGDQVRGYNDSRGNYVYPSFLSGPYPQFVSHERDIAQGIQTGQRSGRISRRDADDLMNQLQQIQDREVRIYRGQGRYIRADDSRRITHDLDLLSQSLHRAERH